MAVFAINDRTEEFRQIVAAAQRRQATKPGKQRLLDTAQQHAASSDAQPRRSEFARGAAEIGRGISATMAKLEKLAQLAKKKTLFDDRPVEINEVSWVMRLIFARLDSITGWLTIMLVDLCHQARPVFVEREDQEPARSL